MHVVGNDDDTLEFPPVTVVENRIQSRTAVDYLVYALGTIVVLWALTVFFIMVIIAVMR